MAKSTTTTATVETIAPKNILEKHRVTAKFRGFTNKAVGGGKKKFVLRFSVEGQESPLFLDKFYATEQDRNAVAALVENKEYSVQYTEKAALTADGQPMLTKAGVAIMNRTLWSSELSYNQKVRDADNF